MNIITRFPPSPTGNFHVGSARTALFNYLFAKQNGGTMYLRFEDTDKERSKREYEDDIVAGLDWLGIEYTFPETPRQSGRTDLYTKHLKTLIGKGAAEEAEESKDGEGRVVRFKNPNKEITFTDLIRGDVTVDTTDLGDFVIAKNINEPLYHLAVVVDDHDMGVTHVIRGEDHISNTPRQILIQEALSFSRPAYAHIPLILGTDKKKLSKRHGALSVNEYKKQGYLPEAFVNFLALLGWHPQNDQEFFTLDELVQHFDLSRVQKAGAVFDTEKLNWLNKHHVNKLSDEAFLEGVRVFLPERVQALPQYGNERLAQLIPIFRERINVFSEITDMAEKGELEYFFDKPGLNAQELSWKDTPKKTTHKHISTILEKIEKIENNSFTSESVKSAVWEYATEQGRGEALWPMRFALSGKKHSPDPFALAEVLGKEETISRLESAIDTLS